MCLILCHFTPAKPSLVRQSNGRNVPFCSGCKGATGREQAGAMVQGLPRLTTCLLQLTGLEFGTAPLPEV